MELVDGAMGIGTEEMGMKKREWGWDGDKLGYRVKLYDRPAMGQLVWIIYRSIKNNLMISSNLVVDVTDGAGNVGRMLLNVGKHCH